MLPSTGTAIPAHVVLFFQFLPALVAGILGLLTWSVASSQRDISSKQRDIAQAKLSLDLFERRIVIFKATWQYMLESMPGGPNGMFATIPGLDEASFLFGPEISDYMREAQGKSFELRAIGSRALANGDVIQPADIVQHTELLRWFADQRQGGCHKVFSPYLDFGHWRG